MHSSATTNLFQLPSQFVATWETLRIRCMAVISIVAIIIVWEVHDFLVSVPGVVSLSWEREGF